MCYENSDIRCAANIKMTTEYARILDRLNVILAELQTQFAESSEFRICANGTTFTIPKHGAESPHHKSDIWTRSTHRNNSVHEPGLVGAIWFLADALAGQEIDFFDIGALFGYFTLLARACFVNSNIHAIEANPAAFEALTLNIRMSLGDEHGIHLHDFLLSDCCKTGNFYRKGFTLTPLDDQTPANLEAKTVIKQKMAEARNLGGEFLRLEQVDFLHFLRQSHYKNNHLIVKIDVEGYQAVFLPSATQYLIEQRAILLMEFDSVEKIERFNTSNMELCRPFTDANYHAYWLNHRSVGKLAVPLETAALHGNVLRNSLAILLPPDCFDRPR